MGHTTTMNEINGGPPVRRHPDCAIMERILANGLDVRIARDIFLAGSRPGSRCQRLQFLGGEYPDKEIAQGGMTEENLVKVIGRSLADRPQRLHI